MQIQPYLFYAGRAEEAIELYRRALGAEVQALMRMKDSPMPRPAGNAAASDDKIMHASLRIAGSTVMLSDGECEGEPHFEGFGLSLAANDLATARRYFDGLADGGEVRMPLQKTFFAENFGMVKDRFGVLWMIIQGQAH